jgi:hypothetical protein
MTWNPWFNHKSNKQSWFDLKTKPKQKKNKNRLLAKNSKKKSNKTDQTHKKIKNNEEHPRNRNETHQHGTQHRPYLAKQNKKAHTC